eukprot:320602-Hanusia_phi.AAC.1
MPVTLSDSKCPGPGAQPRREPDSEPQVTRTPGIGSDSDSDSPGPGAFRVTESHGHLALAP